MAKADRPAVFGTPELVAYAKAKGVEVFYNSGLKESQRAAAVTNLKKVGADINLDADHMFLKDAANPPAYLSACATPGTWTCTTVQYKSGTRKHIEDLGYDVIATLCALRGCALSSDDGADELRPGTGPDEKYGSAGDLAVPNGHDAGDSVGYFDAAAAVAIAVRAFAPAGVAQFVLAHRL
ncbi:hypothetical protein STRTUCAR8_03795 [Streptomyces turgidiscabies Car8]|uniref:Uncharacterized protein n=1 Tax=Streptomyces turgidiscabies (strain Car8) TaxID=698760 RepID=L7FHK9_STRT8|nr:hypothetical protein STRTUCAR8_03795 [Streptomyces turgidiscabies Car8]